MFFRRRRRPNWDKPTVVTVDTFDDFTYTVAVAARRMTIIP